MESYRVEVKKPAAKEVEALPLKERRRIVERIRALGDDPRPSSSKKLSGREAYRLRQGDYRIIYTVSDDDRLVVVFAVSHRRDAYR